MPLFVYAVFGSSRQLAVGPVALVSLLVSNVLSGIVDSSDDLYTEMAILLALMVGVLECVMGLLRYSCSSSPSSTYYINTICESLLNTFFVRHLENIYVKLML